MSDLAYRDLNLSITIKGNGNKIKRFTVDEKTAANKIGNQLKKGNHNIVIELG